MDKSKKKVNEVLESIESLKSLFNDDIKQLNEEIKSLEEKKSIISDVKKVIDVSLINDPIKLNVGGMKFQTSKSTLTKVAGSYFDVMFSGQIEIQPITGKSNSFFIDRDGDHFRYILNFLRDGNMNDIPVSIQSEVKREMEFYRLIIPSKSDLINNDQFKIINDWLGGSKNFKPIFKAKKDGFGSTVFHTKCDNKGATVTIIKSTDGCIFGGYNSQSWNSSGNYYGNNKCFIFTIINKNGIPPTKYAPKGINTYCVYGYSSYGPTFGGGHDICIADQSNLTSANYQYFPHSYSDTTGKGKATFASSYNFTVEDYEVFSVL